MMPSRSAQSLRNISVGLIVQGIELILKFVSRTIFIASLPISYLGVSGLFGEILTLLSLAELGLGGAIGFALYRPLAVKDHRQIGSLMNFYRLAYAIIGGIVLLMGIALVPFLDKLVRQPKGITESITLIYLLYLFNVVSSYFLSYRSTLLLTDQKGYIIQGLSSGISICRTAIQAYILLVYKSFYAYLLSESVLMIGNNLLLYWYVGRHYPFLSQTAPPLSKEERKSIFGNLKALSLYKIGTILVNGTENTIMAPIVGIEQLGYYANYLIFVTFGNRLLGAVFGGMNASVGNLNAVSSRQHSHHIFEAMHLLNFWLYGLFSICFFVCIEDLLNLWLGKQYLLGTPLALIIALNFYIKGMQQAVWVFKDSYGLFRYGRYLTLIQAAVHIGIASLFGWLFGMGGALVGAGISRLFTTVWYDPYALFRHGFQLPVLSYYRSYAIYAFQFILTLTGAYLLITHWLAPLPLFPRLMCKMVLSFSITNVMFWLFYGRSQAFMMVRKRLLELLRSHFTLTK